MSSPNHSLTDFDPNTQTESGSKDTEAKTPTDTTTEDSDEPDNITPGETVSHQHLPDWTTWETHAVEIDGLTAVFPKQISDTYFVEPAPDYKIRLDTIAVLPNKNEATNARLNSPYNSLKTHRNDLPTTYAELNDEDAKPFDPLITAQSIVYNGYKVIDEHVLETAYRLTQGQGRISPEETRITPLENGFAIIENTVTNTTYLFGQPVRALNNPAVADANYTPETQTVAGITIPDSNPRVKETLEILFDQLESLYSITFTKHVDTKSNYHTFATKDGSEYSIKWNTLSHLEKCTLLSNTDALTGDLEIESGRRTATPTVRAKEYDYEHGDWQYDTLKESKVFGVNLHLKNYGGSSPYSRTNGKDLTAEYYTLHLQEKEDKPDMVRISTGSTQKLQTLDLSELSYV